MKHLLFIVFFCSGLSGKLFAQQKHHVISHIKVFVKDKEIFKNRIRLKE